jgi:hypothetical protein
MPLLWKYENVESIPVDSRYKLDNEVDDCRYLGIYAMYHEANTSTVRLSIPEYSNISNEYWHYLMQEAWVIASLSWIIDWSGDP